VKPQDIAEQGRRKDRIATRLDPEKQWESATPVMSGAGVCYQVSRPGIGLDSRLGDDSPEEVAVHVQERLVACGSGGSP